MGALLATLLQCFVSYGAQTATSDLEKILKISPNSSPADPSGKDSSAKLCARRLSRVYSRPSSWCGMSACQQEKLHNCLRNTINSRSVSPNKLTSFCKEGARMSKFSEMCRRQCTTEDMLLTTVRVYNDQIGSQST